MPVLVFDRDGTVGPNVTYAAAMLGALPVVIFFLWAQRWFINAIAGTGNDSETWPIN